MKIFTIIALLGIITAVAVQPNSEAREAVATDIVVAKKKAAISLVAGGSCNMKVTANVNVTLQGKENTLKAARDAIDARVASIKAKVKELGIGDAKIQSMSYNINPQMDYSHGHPSGVRDYNYSGNVGLRLDDEDKAVKLVEHIIANKMQANFSVSKHRNNNQCR